MALLLYWRGEDPKSSFTLLAPLYYSAQGQDESLRVLLPIHFHYRVKGTLSTLWGPYFEKSSLTARTRFVVPFFWHIKPFDKTQRSYRLLFPLYLKTEDQDQKAIYSPFFWVYKDSEVSQGLIPPYFWQKKQDSAFEVGFPLYWRFFKKETSGFKDIQVAVPWFRLRSESGSLRSFFPIYWGRTKILKEEKSTGTVKSSSWDVFFPLLFHSKMPDGSEKTIKIGRASCRERV